MPDTCLCAFILREQPEAVITRLAQAALRNYRMVVSAITRAGLALAAHETGPAATQLAEAGTPIGPNDIAIAGHAIAVSAVLMTGTEGEFAGMPGLTLEDWVK
jgi:tRNA(fMet)-specific endonuclease VapC